MRADTVSKPAAALDVCHGRADLANDSSVPRSRELTRVRAVIVKGTAKLTRPRTLGLAEPPGPARNPQLDPPAHLAILATNRSRDPDRRPLPRLVLDVPQRSRRPHLLYRLDGGHRKVEGWTTDGAGSGRRRKSQRGVEPGCGRSVGNPECSVISLSEASWALSRVQTDLGFRLAALFYPRRGGLSGENRAVLRRKTGMLILQQEKERTRGREGGRQLAAI